MNRRILVIDDEASVRKSFELALKNSDYELYTAASGREGLALFEEQDYSLVYLDLKMPGLSGVETLLKIRERDRSVPVYIVTAFHREFFEDLAGARKNGVDFELLMKPLGLDQIREITDAILEGTAGAVRGNSDV